MSGATAAHVQPISPFTILEFPDAADPTVVYLEHLTGNLEQEEVRDALPLTVRRPVMCPCSSSTASCIVSRT